MPRLVEGALRRAPPKILVSAWSCVSRNGFDATLMDDVILLAEWARRWARLPQSDGELIRRLVDYPPLNLFSVMVKHPDLLGEWMPLTTRVTNGVLPAADRELVTLRTALRCGSRYEWDQHAPVALAAGLTESDLSRIVNGPEGTGWSSAQKALLRCVDELHAMSVVSDATWREPADQYDERQLIELVILIGHYHEVAFVLNALHGSASDRRPP